MPTARISVNVDSEIKQGAQKILNEIGMDMTTAVDLLLRTIVREERIPFDLRTERAYKEDVYRKYVLGELERSKAQAADPDTKLVSHDDVMSQLTQQREARREV